MQRIKQLMLYVHTRLFTSYSFYFERIYSKKQNKIEFHVTAAIWPIRTSELSLPSTLAIMWLWW